jgi:hypothetical protein
VRQRPLTPASHRANSSDQKAAASSGNRPLTCTDSVGVAVSSINTSRTNLSRHSGRLTLTLRRCRRRVWSSPLSSLKERRQRPTDAVSFDRVPWTYLILNRAIPNQDQHRCDPRSCGVGTGGIEPLTSSLSGSRGHPPMRHRRRLTAIKEAVAIYRRLAAGNPAADEPDLATSLNNRSVDLGQAGRRADADPVTEEIQTCGHPPERSEGPERVLNDVRRRGSSTPGRRPNLSRDSLK